MRGKLEDMGQDNNKLKKIVIAVLATFFVATLSLTVCAQEQQAPQEPTKGAITRAAKGQGRSLRAY